MKLSIYQIDAFATRVFEGNPAAVIPLEAWLDESVMQSIAIENNLSETAFCVPRSEIWDIRWFTPGGEVKLCGHATLATAWYLFRELGESCDEIGFDSLSGPLSVRREGDLLTLDFPLQKPQPCSMPETVRSGLGGSPIECLLNEDYLVVYEDHDEVVGLTPDFDLLSQVEARGVIVTAPSQEYDFVSRFFAPAFGIPEDPVTGSSFTQLAPYWVNRLGKNPLRAKQVSARGGEVICEVQGDRVLISGHAVPYLEGEISI
jgi:PhzF family phenazine biosynthesis protein